MEFKGERVIQASAETIWHAILDADVLATCVPGARNVTGSAEDGFVASITRSIGPMKIGFDGKLTVTDMHPYERLTLRGSGRGNAKATLTEMETGTRVAYDVTVNIGDRFGRMGKSVIGRFAKSMADQFFSNLQKAVSQA